MIENYKPNRATIRDHYAGSDVGDYIPSIYELRGSQFDAWLQDELRQAWAEGFDRGFYNSQTMPRDSDASESLIPNPYQQEEVTP